jgi:cell wall assembly regulator SMI1
MAQNLPTVTSIATSIKKWLHHKSSEYPGVYQTIRQPASDEAITECETSIGLPLPVDLFSLLKVFDGQSYSKRVYEFPCSPWSRILSCKDIADRYHSLEKICEMCSVEFDIECVWDCKIAANHRANKEGFPVLGHNDLWIPFAESYSGGGGPPVLWLLDMSPPEGVVSGRVIGFGGEGDSLSLWAPSLPELLQDVLTVMRKRSPEPPEGLEDIPEPEVVANQPELRHRKVLYDDGQRIWHQYRDDNN